MLKRLGTTELDIKRQEQKKKLEPKPLLQLFLPFKNSMQSNLDVKNQENFGQTKNLKFNTFTNEFHDKNDLKSDDSTKKSSFIEKLISSISQKAKSPENLIEKALTEEKSIKNQIKPSDKIEIPFKTSESKVLISIFQPKVPDFQEISPKQKAKTIASSIFPFPPATPKPEVEESTQSEFSRKYTIEYKNPQNIISISPNNQTPLPEIIPEDSITASQETSNYLKKVKDLQKSKKRCTAESELLKNYQKLVNYIP
jgi:hypothetical protein